jgi:hypothetical protein
VSRPMARVRSWFQYGAVTSSELNKHFNSVELYFMLPVTSAVKTVLSISQNGISPITLNIKLGNPLNMDIINACISLSSFLFIDASRYLVTR